MGVDVVITGAKGLLGQALLATAPAGLRVHGTHREEVDLTCTEAVQKAFARWQPHCIFHCAAYTRVDQAEKEPERAYADNALATWNVAAAAARWDAVMVYVSTDYVFDGETSRPYREFDPPRPLSVYGWSKWVGEVLVGQQVRRHFIVRTSGLFGPGGRHFVGSILERAQRGERLRVVVDQVCARTYAPDLAQALWALWESPLYGIYHLTNAGASSWFEFAQEVLRRAGFPAEQVQPITTEEWRPPAPRPRYSVLENFCWRLTGHPPLRPVEEALEEYLLWRKFHHGIPFSQEER